MSALFILAIVVLTAYAALHAGTREKDRWVIAILAIPLLGAFLYFWIDILPTLRGRAAGGTDLPGVPITGISRKELQNLQKQLSLSDNFSNRKAMADGLVQAGLFEKAIELYESCLNGIHKDDPTIRDGLAKALFCNRDYAEAKVQLEKFLEMRGNVKSYEQQLLLAVTLERLGETETALAAFDEIAGRYPGEEARCRYALLLKESGQPDRARQVFQDVVQTAALNPDYYQRANRAWIQMAKKELVKLKLTPVVSSRNAS